MARRSPANHYLEEEGESNAREAPSSQTEGVGGRISARAVMLDRAAKMRREPTEPERRMWMALRDSRLAGFKFGKRTTIGGGIVDFFCPAKRPIVEIDGETHDAQIDAACDRRMQEEYGYHTLRYTNLKVMRNLEGVLTSIPLALQDWPDRWRGSRVAPPPTPSSREKGALDRNFSPGSVR